MWVGGELKRVGHHTPHLPLQRVHLGNVGIGVPTQPLHPVGRKAGAEGQHEVADGEVTVLHPHPLHVHVPLQLVRDAVYVRH